ncbi:MAG: undecaprenyl-diphosphate phosphatase [Candidatus Anstonellales archaeon]
MNVFDAIILGIVQGITEWLPISSTLHLVITRKLFGMEFNYTFDIVVMLGTTMALLLFYRKELVDLINHIIKRDSDLERNFVICILIAVLTTGVVGILIREYALTFFEYQKNLAIFAFMNSVFLAMAHFMILKRPSKMQNNIKEEYRINYKQAVFIGLAQVLSLFPGISRAGITFSAGILIGLDKYNALLFSLFLGIPTMFSASVVEGFILSKNELSILPIETVIVGLITSFVFGFLSLKFLIYFVRRSDISIFVVYSFLIALLINFII